MTTDALETMPEMDDRQLDDPEQPDGYLESDRSWERRNPVALAWLIDNHREIRAALIKASGDLQPPKGAG